MLALLASEAEALLPAVALAAAAAVTVARLARVSPLPLRPLRYALSTTLALLAGTYGWELVIGTGEMVQLVRRGVAYGVFAALALVAVYARRARLAERELLRATLETILWRTRV